MLRCSRRCRVLRRPFSLFNATVAILSALQIALFASLPDRWPSRTVGAYLGQFISCAPAHTHTHHTRANTKRQTRDRRAVGRRANVRNRQGQGQPVPC